MYRSLMQPVKIVLNTTILRAIGLNQSFLNISFAKNPVQPTNFSSACTSLTFYSLLISIRFILAKPRIYPQFTPKIPSRKCA